MVSGCSGPQLSLISCIVILPDMASGRVGTLHSSSTGVSRASVRLEALPSDVGTHTHTAPNLLL